MTRKGNVVDFPVQAWAEEKEKELREFTERLPPGGGNGGGGMDQRIGRLEKQVDSICSKLDTLIDRIGAQHADLVKTIGSMQVDITKSLGEATGRLGKVETQLEHCPTRFEFYTVVSGSIVLLGGLVTIAARLGWLGG